MSWIKCSERLPDRDGVYLVFAPSPVVDDDPRIDIYRYDPDDKRKRRPNWGWNAVTHWQPLPEPPKDGE